MTTFLGPHDYGKAQTRVVRITRDGATHRIRDLNVSVALSGAMEQVYYTGDNSPVLPTDSVKNTVFAFAKEHGAASPEAFGIALAEHFTTSQEAVHRARVRIEEYAWERIGTDSRSAAAGGAGHSFARTGQETRVAEASFDGRSFEVLGGLRGLTVLNSTDSEFRGFVRDRYTTLEEAADRILATDVDALWRYRWTGGAQQPDWDKGYARARRGLLEAFTETYSLSLQQTLYRMGQRVVEDSGSVDGETADGGAADGGAVDEVRLSLPNKHHFLVDLAPFGVENDGEVYFAADRPYGLIEGTVLREGAQARIPAR